jgi:hypothetical protein
MLFSFCLAILIQTHSLQLWHVYFLALLLGTVTAFNTTAEQTFLGLSIVQLLPAIASKTLKGNANTLGSLIGAAGAGAFVGTVFALPFVSRIKKPCIAIGGAVIWAGAWYCLLSFCRLLPFCMLCQFMASLGAANVLTLSIGLAQELTPAKMRASIISAFMMIVFGLQPVASFIVGKSADLFSLHDAILTNGILMILLSSGLLMIPILRRLKVSVSAPSSHGNTVDPARILAKSC